MFKRICILSLAFLFERVQSSCLPFSSSKSEIFPARYLKNERGVVHLDDLIAGGRVGSAAFTLPVTLL